MTVPMAALASGSGSNLGALLEHEGGNGGYRIELVVTDRPCAAEERGRAKGHAVVRVCYGDRGPGEIGEEMLRHFERHDVQAVLLAGFIRLLPASVCAAFRRRVLNIHPALLPAFGGKGMYGSRVHEAVLRSGAALSGPTIHYVNEHYDRGMILAQWPVPVSPEDTPSALAARVLAVEHVLYPAAAQALARSIAGDGGPPVFRWRPGAGDGPEDLRQAISQSFGNALEVPE